MDTIDTQSRPSTERWRFLERPAERLRYAAMASLIKSFAGRGQIVEIGSGDGHLLGWLDPGMTSAYVAVDIETAALARLAHDRIAIVRQAARLEDFTPDANPIAALVASEVLYYVEEPGRQLLRIWRAAGHVEIALVSSVLPRPDKPSWQRGYDRVARAIGQTQWPVLDRIRIESAEAKLAWEIVALRPGAAQS